MAATQPPPAPGVSVVIPHYGDPTLAVQLVEQLLAQVTDRPIEIIVADDCSPVPFPPMEGVIVARRPTNGGFGANVNHGAARATQELLLILNSDLSIGPTFIEDLVSAGADRMPAVIGPALLDPDGHAAWSGRHFPTVSQQCVEWFTALSRFRDTDWWHRGVGHDLAATPGRVVAVDWLVGAALLLPTQAFRSVNGFDELFHMNCEEIDLQQRLHEAGVPAIFLGTVSCTHIGGGSSDDEKRRKWLVQSRLRYAEKWSGRRGKTALRAALGATTLINLGVNSMRRLAGARIHPAQTAAAEWRLLRD